MPTLQAFVQYASECADIPDTRRLRHWAKVALRVDTQVTIRIVDEPEGRELNHTYRGKDYATNVLTFVLTEEPCLMGDIVICAPVVEKEAREQHKDLHAHYAHLVVHGILHLHGYDHETEPQAELMEGIETAIITKLGYPTPYLIT
ncbi:MAG: rRNA maturation RNase YbeY [Betaproteobacteria bacterium]|nr:rRNA maturation RNase YbeY [Betaproteobacteria bacterium]